MIQDNDFIRYNIVDEKTPSGCMLTGHYKRSYAFYTLSYRVPIIVTNLVDLMTKQKDDIAEKFSAESREDLKKCIAELSKLKYELQTDKPFLELAGDDSDQDVWNRLIEELKLDSKSSYFSAPWLYSECYIYRRIKSIFAEVPTLKDFDYFSYHKQPELENSMSAVSMIIASVNEFKESQPTEQQIEDFFCKLLKVNLWGNKNDLSISLGKEISSGEKRDAIAEVEKFNENLLVDDTKNIWKCLKSAGSDATVDFINDNAGYELLCDLVLAEFILCFNLAKSVQFRLKSIPWFISDAMLHDFNASIEQFKTSNSEVLKNFGNLLNTLVDTGKLSVVTPSSHFFTGPYEFCKMAEIDNELYQSIGKANLVIIKGDLNYRKLLADRNWTPSVSFEESLQGFKPTSLCAMRTVKADLISGISQEVYDKLSANDEEKSWMATGQYGVIQFVSK